MEKIIRRARIGSKKYKRSMYIFNGTTFEDYPTNMIDGLHTCDLKAITQGLVEGELIGVVTSSGEYSNI